MTDGGQADGGPGARLLVWLRADLGVMADSTGAVSEWRDQSGSANHAFACDATSKPVRIDGGMPTVRFDGVDDCLKLPSGFSDFRSGLTSFVAVKTTATTNVSAVRFWDLGESFMSLKEAIVFVRFRATGTSLLYQAYTNTTPGPAVEAISSVFDGTAATYSVVANGGDAGTETAATLYVNGLFKNRSTVLVPTVIDRASNLIGRSNLFNADNHLQGDLWELRIYQGALGDTEREAIENEIKSRWSL